MRTSRHLRPFLRISGLGASALLLALTSAPARSENLRTGAVFLNPMGASVEVQNEILGQMKNAGVRVIRTNIRPADRYIDFVSRAYAQGIRIVAIFDLQFAPDTPTNPKQLPPLSAADPRLSEPYFQTLLGAAAAA